MIALTVYGARKANEKYKERKEKKRRQATGDTPAAEVADPSDEFVSPTSSLSSSKRAYRDKVEISDDSSSRYSSTLASEPSSAVEPASAVSNREISINSPGSYSTREPGSATTSLAPEPRPKSATSDASMDYRQYQQYVERQSQAYLKGKMERPPQYEAIASPTLVSPPQSYLQNTAQGLPPGRWVYVPEENFQPQPTRPMGPPAGIAASAQGTANELPGDLPVAAPQPLQPRNSQAHRQETPHFELPAKASELKHQPSSSTRKSEISDNGLPEKVFELP